MIVFFVQLRLETDSIRGTSCIQVLSIDICTAAVLDRPQLHIRSSVFNPQLKKIKNKKNQVIDYSLWTHSMSSLKAFSSRSEGKPLFLECVIYVCGDVLCASIFYFYCLARIKMYTEQKCNCNPLFLLMLLMSWTQIAEFSGVLKMSFYIYKQKHTRQIFLSNIVHKSVNICVSTSSLPG